MVNKGQDEHDFDFSVGGDVISKLFYLVDGIYPQHKYLLPSDSDPHTKLVSSFTSDQESLRKDIE
jgi:hypothetical protein